MFLKLSRRYRGTCLIVFVRKTLLWLIPLSNCFLNVCLHTLFAALLKFFLPPTTSASSGAAISIKSVPTPFAAGTTCLRKMEWNCCSPFSTIAPNPLSRFQPIPLFMESLVVLKQPPCNVFFAENEDWKLF